MTKQRIQTLRRPEKGSILMIGVLSLFVVSAFAGLALDASYMYFNRRTMQTAADAGAYGGAMEILRGTGDTVAAARSDTARNGFTDGTEGVTVTVNSPPATGPRMGDTQYVEVIISRPQPTWFMRALSFSSVNVTARAVAGVGNTSNACVYALNRNTSNVNNGFFANGTTESSFACAVYSNANFRAVGGACVITPGVSYTGDYSNSNEAGNCGPGGVGEGVPVVDPLLNRYALPSYGSCDANNYRVNNGATVTISPGTYCGGITITGSVEHVIFSPGEYVLVDGGMSVNGSATVTGNGVTFFNTFTTANRYDEISLNGSGTVVMSAPTSGDYAGLLFWQDPRVTWHANNGSSIAGGVDSVYNGILYFPTTDLTYSGNSSTSSEGTDGYTMLIGYNVTVSGSARINSDYSALGGNNPFRNVLFVE